MSFTAMGGGDTLWRRMGMRLLECRAMKRNQRLAIVLLAAAMHLVAPLAANAMTMPAAMSDDFCSAARGAPAAPLNQRMPMPSGEHHCAHAPCCVGGALDSASPPPRVQVALLAARDPVRALPLSQVAVPPSAITAAQPRGPPAIL